MKRNGILIIAVALSIIFLAGPAWALPLKLKEIYLGGKKDADSFLLIEKDYAQGIPGTGNKARFNFDLAGLGGVGQLLRGNRSIGSPVDPTMDETAFDPVGYQTPYMAYVDFFVSDWSSEFTSDPREKVRVNIESGDFVRNRTFTLENDSDGSKKIRVDLAVEGLLGHLVDGELLAMAIAPAFSSVVNSFTLDRVVLYAESHKVPEPATMLLLGSGLMGLAVAARRKRLVSKS